MATRKQNLRTARLLSRLRFGPEVDALSMLLSDARQTRDVDTRNADAGAEGLSASLAALEPRFEQTYGQANAARTQGLNEALGGLVGTGSNAATDTIRASMGREAAGAVGRNMEAQGRDIRELGQRQVDARAGAVAQKQRASSTYKADAAKIASRLASIARDQGAFIETEFGELTSKDREFAIKEANTDISAERLRLEGERVDLTADTLAETRRANRADEAQARRDARDKGKEKDKGGARNRRTADQRAGTKGTIRSLAGLVSSSPHAKPGHGQRLLKEIQRKAKRDPLLARDKTAKDPLLIRAAAEYAIYGRLGPKTRKQLQASYGIGGV
jgi:hypothetical protein